MARTRYNDCEPLLRLGRSSDARTLLLSCRAVFEAERHIEMLGMVYSTLAHLEDETGGRVAAIHFEEVALAYKYQVGQPEACAISHHNLAIYLERQGVHPATVLAHRLAAAAIFLQMQSGLLPRTVRDLANSDLPPAPPAFAEVAQRVESVEGLRFRSLFERLPRTAPDGDAAIAAVWQRVTDEKRRRDERKQRQDAVLGSAPAAVQAAFELKGDESTAALRGAGGSARGGSRRPGEGPAGGRSDPRTGCGAATARLGACAAGDRRRGERRGTARQIEPVLAEGEQKGWRLTEAAHRIWAGERDATALTAGIDGNSAQMVRRVLELSEQ